MGRNNKSEQAKRLHKRDQEVNELSITVAKIFDPCKPMAQQDESLHESLCKLREVALKFRDGRLYSPSKQLTRMKEIADLLSSGLSIKEIAEKCNLTTSTIAKYLLASRMAENVAKEMVNKIIKKSNE